MPVIPAADLDDGGGWIPAAVILVFLAGGLIVATLRRTATPEDLLVEDSADFRDALGIWHKVILEANPTPRGIKRHQNRLRFQAMRLRPLDAPSNLLDRVFKKPLEPLRNVSAAGAEAASTKSGVIDDPRLVAIGALHAYDEARGSQFPAAATTSPPPSLPDEIEEAIGKHQARFPGKWPPTNADVSAYVGLGKAMHD